MDWCEPSAQSLKGGGGSKGYLLNHQLFLLTFIIYYKYP